VKILRHSGTGVAGIFFPIGKPPEGTCQYASDECIKNCYALKKDYDERVNIPESEKKAILKYFMGNPIITVCSQIIKEMGELQAIVLSWFTSGDCLDEDVNRIYQMMMLLQEAGVVQNGFTRSKQLWQKLADNQNLNYDILRIILTVETLNADGVVPRCGRDAPYAIWAVPDYDAGVVNLYQGRLGYQESYGSCGFSGVRTHKFEGKEVEIATNCLGCFKQKLGCFVDSKIG